MEKEEIDAAIVEQMKAVGNDVPVSVWERLRSVFVHRLISYELQRQSRRIVSTNQRSKVGGNCNGHAHHRVSLRRSFRGRVDPSAQISLPAYRKAASTIYANGENPGPIARLSKSDFAYF
jgi:hypothetical protein